MELKNQLEEAYKLEQMGDFQSASTAYQNLLTQDLDEDSLVYVERSIAACDFYLKNYSQAIDRYSRILRSFKLPPNIIAEITQTLQLCHLYGEKKSEAKEYFQKKIEANLFPEQILWDYWYLGQYYFQIQDYINAESCYSNSLTGLEKDDYRYTFFYAHLLSAKLKNSDEDIRSYFPQILNLEDQSFGLLKMVVALILRKEDPNSNWRKIFDAGMGEATQAHYLENIELGNKLLLECI